MSSLQQILASLARDGEDHVIDAPEDWSQGRTLFGGIMAALSYTALRETLGDLGPLRAAQFAFIGPASGRLAFRPELLRRGKSSAVAGVDCRSESGIAARATFTFGAARESLVAHDRVARPDVPPPDACEPFHRTRKPLPGFLSRFEFRLAAGARLFEPDEAPEFAIWARLVEGAGDDRIAALLAFGDALPGAAMAAFPKPAPISTMTWGIDFHLPLPPATEWHLIRTSSEVAADGYSLQAMGLYSETGEPIATARQTVALFI